MNVIVIGGGASGVMHALYLKHLNSDINVTILEQNDRILKKLLKTGNGRCNISNSLMEAKFYNNEKVISNLYNKVKPEVVINFFKSLGLLLKNGNSTRLYPCSESANTVVDLLRNELAASMVDVRCSEEVIKIRKNKLFEVTTNRNKYIADYVVVAAGSIAQEKTNIYEILKELNHSITDIKPGLVALKVKQNLQSIRGIRVKCNAKVINDNKVIYEEVGEVLFKENGLSGVVILNLSRYVKPGYEISLDLFFDYPDINNYISSFLYDKDIEDILRGLLPKMLANYIYTKANGNLGKIFELIHDLRFKVVSDYGFNQGQIVLGGVRVDEINEDFSSKVIDGLYLVGEVLDIDGASGGYNLHFAWSSGIMSAISIFEKSL
ncbi:MAG TPA: aminoacetone oxidase family FAD-binding enzyme [Acholeplasmataceae bacterium]|nr:aminoacetone oxidase family FAD-binding enzyme [Acholeplasmataceae bacterium]